MICCKIITNFSTEQGNFGQLCSFLGKKGSWMWHGGSMYFADVEGPTDEKTIIKLVKKAGYKQPYVDVYDANNEPHDNDEVHAWVADKLMKIYYLQFERDNQQVLQETSKGLQELNRELDNMIREAIAEQTKSEPTEDSDNGR